jgi:hypothetical protein
MIPTTVPEMAAVVAAMGPGTAAPPMLIRELQLNAVDAIPAGALSASTVNRPIRRAAVRFYQR